MLPERGTSRLLQATVLIGFLFLALLLVSTALAQPGAAPQGQALHDGTPGGYVPTPCPQGYIPSPVPEGYVPAPCPTDTPVTTATATITPTATATSTPTITPTATPHVVTPPSKVEVRVVVDPGKSVAVDAAGNRITVTPGEAKATKETVIVQGRPTQQIKIELPMTLVTGNKLESFKDESTGTEVTKTQTVDATGQIKSEFQVKIPLKDAQGVVQAKIVAKLADAPVGTGTKAEAVVTKLTLETETKTVNLAAAKPDVGQVQVSLSAILADIPTAANISVNVKADLDASTQRGFVLAATKAKTELKEVAYVVEIKKEGLADQAVVASSEIQMCVGRTWYAKNASGTGSFAIFRLGDGGERELLATTIDAARSTTTTVCFVGKSPNGLSVFALASLATPPQPTPTPIAVAAGTVRQALSPFVARGLTSPDGKVTIDVPVGGVETGLDLQYTARKVTEVPGSKEYILLGPQFRLEVLADGTAQEPFRFSGSVSLALKYGDADLAASGNRETELQVITYDTGLKEWVSLGGTVDPVKRTITALNRGVGLFSLGVLQPPPTPTPEVPVVGDYAPSSGLLLILALMGALLVAFGVYYLRSPRREGEA